MGMGAPLLQVQLEEEEPPPQQALRPAEGLRRWDANSVCELAWRGIELVHGKKNI